MLIFLCVLHNTKVLGKLQRTSRWVGDEGVLLELEWSNWW